MANETFLTIENGVVTKCDENAVDVVIPEVVTEIGEYAFEGCKSLSSVVIPEGVTKIGDYAFYGCKSLSSVVIPASVTEIGRQAFLKCESLSSVVIPEGVTEIGKGAFLGCESLSSVVIPEGVTKIGRIAFKGCKSLSSVVIPEGVTEIGAEAFSYCESLSSVVIGEGVTEIGWYAFYRCKSLKSIVIPSTVTEICNNAFDGCEAVENVVSASASYPFNEKTSKLYDATKKTKKVILVLTAAKEEAKKAKIKQVQNASASAVLDSILSEHQAVTDVIRNEKDAYLRVKASDTGIEILLPDSKVQKWMQTLPGLLDLAEAGADSAALKKFADENGLEDSAKKYVTLSKDGSVKWKKRTEPVHLFIPSGVSAIAADGFERCDSLKFAAIPGSVTEIGSWAFSWCKSLERVAIPDSVTEIRDAAFYACKSLKSFEVPPKVVKISSYSFDCCYSLGKIAIGEGVEEIRVGAFRWCESLKSVELPSTIRRLEGQSFVDCRALEEIRYNGTIAQWKAVEKERCWNENVPAKVVKCADDEEPIAIKTEDVRTETYSLKIIDGGLRKCSCTPDARKVVVPDGVTEIDPEALSSEAVESLEIPASMARFGSCALNGCSSLFEIIFCGTIEQWNAIEKRNDWNKDVPARTVKCTDGETKL